MRKIPGICLHWPAVKQAYLNSQSGQKLVNSFRQDHKKNRGWLDIGYHYLIHKNQQGKWIVFDGRNDSLTGAHAGTNEGNRFLGINVCYAMDNPVIPDELVAVITQEIATLAKTYKFVLNRQTVRAHRDFLPTECPGNTLYNLLPTLIEKAKALEAVVPKVVQPAPPASRKKEEQISKIKIDLAGEAIEGIRVNSQAYIYVGELKKLGYEVTYVRESDTVKVIRRS